MKITLYSLIYKSEIYFLALFFLLAEGGRRTATIFFTQSGLEYTPNLREFPQVRSDFLLANYSIRRRTM